MIKTNIPARLPNERTNTVAQLNKIAFGKGLSAYGSVISLGNVLRSPYG